MSRKYEFNVLNLYYMKRAFKYLLLIVLLYSCKSQYNCTSVGCVSENKVKKKESFFNKTQLKKKHKKPKKGLFKKGVLKN